MKTSLEAVGVISGDGVGGSERTAGTHNSGDRFASLITRAPNWSAAAIVDPRAGADSFEHASR